MPLGTNTLGSSAVEYVGLAMSAIFVKENVLMALAYAANASELSKGMCVRILSPSVLPLIPARAVTWPSSTRR
jgi:hypothetical protein